ncbi:MAG: hypothetical protein ABW328_06635 [Ilumatobacteraceae bacterium]
MTFVLMRWAVRGNAAASDDWVANGARRDAFMLALNLLPFAGISFLWFIGVIRDRIGANEDRFFATVFLGSGLLFIAMLFACGAVAGGLILAVGADGGSATPQLWSFGRRVTVDLLNIYALRMAAVFTISTTSIAARTGLVPRWLVIMGLATGMVLLLTVGRLPWTELIFPLWVFVLSAHILITTFNAQQTSP